MSRFQTPLKFLIVGSGRCGTAMFKHMLDNAGYPCGHEAIFCSDIEKKNQINYLNNRTLRAESSWAAGAFLESDWLDEKIKIVHLIRNPLSVIKSFWEIDFFSKQRAQKPLNKLVYARSTISEESQDRLISSIDHYFQWNQMIHRSLNKIGNPSIKVRLEDFEDGSVEVNDFLEMKLIYTPQRVNLKGEEKKRDQHFPQEIVDRELKKRKDLVHSFGYVI